MASWNALRDTMENRRTYAVVATDDSIYMFGGIACGDKTFQAGLPPIVRIYNCQSRQCYDTQGTYAEIGDVPRAEYLNVGLQYGDKLLLWEGKGLADPSRLFTFDIRSHEWIRPNVVMDSQVEIGVASYCLIDNVVYACGGGNYGQDRRALHVWALDLTTYKWSLVFKKQIFPFNDFAIGPSVAWNGNILTFAQEVYGSPLPEPYKGRKGHKLLRTVAVYNPNTNDCYIRKHVDGDMPIQVKPDELMTYNGKIVSFNGYKLYEFHLERPLWKSAMVGQPGDAAAPGGKAVMNKYGFFYVQRSRHVPGTDELYGFSLEVSSVGTALCRSAERCRD